ncbi:MAG: glycine--tRNA ligase subunit beta [Candidatus Aminicenantes bacterium]|nr:glycine--tRNA ligase subunit beta [Candidatus Aminicenantes bacterium]
MSDFLLEIMTEELPVSHVLAGLEQLREALASELQAAGLLPAGRVNAFGTCRRLIAQADVASRQPDRMERVIGPPRAAAFAADGTPTPAAHGFAKSRGVDVSRLEVFETEKGAYVGFTRAEEGRPAGDVLPEILGRVVSGLTFPKMMRWSENPFRFSRPVVNLLCLVDGRPVSFQAVGLKSSDFTFGHKIFFPDKRIMPRSFQDYRNSLRDAAVLIDPEERRARIKEGARALLDPLGAEILPDSGLMEKLVYDIECPHVFLGAFDEDYLRLPIEILSTAMREGQHLFSVVKSGRQTALFLGVADVREDARGYVRKGNERVLKARLKDADFFWQADVKVPLRKRAEGLARVVFQEKLGSYADKAGRLKKLVAYLCGKVDAGSTKSDAAAAAELCKADLLTDMVREFPSLQGRMGGLLARHQGVSEKSARAIYEHYQPVGLDDASPSTSLGAVLSLADKLDSIVGVMGLGIQSTGSSDPFGLRRNAHGVCKIILDNKWVFPFGRLVETAFKAYGAKLSVSAAEGRAAVLDFFANRLRFIFERQGYRYDLVNAALGPGIDNIFFARLRLEALSALRSGVQFEPFILMAKRVNNILRGQPDCRTNAGLLAEKEEKALWDIFGMVKDNAAALCARGEFLQAQKMVFRLQPALNAFFDKVLVMAGEKKLRNNRLGLLQAVSRLLSQVADYSQVVVEGETLSSFPTGGESIPARLNALDDRQTKEQGKKRENGG